MVLVLGGTGGIGSTIAALLSDRDARVCKHGRTGEYTGDIGDIEQMRVVVNRIINKFGRIDAVVNSLSAPAKAGPAEKKLWPDFIDQLRVQFKAAVDLSDLVLPVMKRQRKGRIINILTSYVVGHPPSGLADYVSAKYALLGLTKALAKEWGKYGITVNAVSPSFIKNSFTRDVPEKFSELLVVQTPLGRLATSSDVAKVVAFLISDEADYITGENIVVAGGSSMD